MSASENAQGIKSAATVEELAAATKDTGVRRIAKGGSEAWQEGEPIKHQETYALCRCGRSGTKPFCDGTHAARQFKDS